MINRLDINLRQWNQASCSQFISASSMRYMSTMKQLSIVFVFASVLSFVASQATVNTCSAPDANGIATFTVQADSSLGKLNFMLIQFDTKRKLVVSSTMLQDDLNTQKNFDRLEPFRPYECSSVPAPNPQPNCTVGYYMTDAQRTSSGRTNWDRGHLVPANQMRFSEDALNSTFYCINIAPQDSYMNQQPWRIVEVSSENKLKTSHGMIMTGVCSANNDKDGPVTYRGWVIPACFWKLVCYRDSITKAPKVVAFIADNTLTNINDVTGQAARRAAALIPKSQQDVLALTNPTLVQQAWTSAFKVLTPGRQTAKLPTVTECINAKTLDAATGTEWANWIKPYN